MQTSKSLNFVATLFIVMLLSQGCGTQETSSRQQLRPVSSDSSNSPQGNSPNHWTRTPTGQTPSGSIIDNDTKGDGNTDGNLGDSNQGANDHQVMGPESEVMVSLYSFYGEESVNHILVSDLDELQDLDEYGRTHETFKVFAAKKDSRQAIYRCFILFQGEKANHFTSLDENCEGDNINTEEKYGYVETRQTAATPRPLYRMFHPELRDHVTTFDLSFYMEQGYQLEIVLGFLPSE